MGRSRNSMIALAIALFFLALAVSAKAQTVGIQTTNASVVIATGNTFQTVLPSLRQPAGSRKSLTIQNNNASDNCWLFIGSATATKATSILLLPGGSYTRYYPFTPSDAIQATCASTSDTLYVDSQ